MASNISWKEFEAIVARLQKTFHSSGGKVTINEKFFGKKSGTYRQIDICIRATIGGEDVLIIVECKKWNRKPDVAAVAAFDGLKKDVGAHIGIMVSTAGFTKAAYRYAESENLNLYRYKDTQRDAWPQGLETAVLLEIWELTPTAAYYILSDGTQERIATDEDLDFIDTKTGEQYPLATFIRKVWESFSAAEKHEWNWLCESDCTTPERPEIRKIVVGAQSKFIRGIRRGTLQFEGLIDEREGHAKVEGWKMRFDGELTQWPKEKQMPFSDTYTVLLRSVFVRSQDLKSKVLQSVIYNGVLELAVKGKDVMKLPVGKRVNLNRNRVIRAADTA